VQVSAPGKVILHGEHAVVYGCKAVAVSVGLTTVVKIASADCLFIRFTDLGLNTEIPKDDLEDLKSQLGSDFK